MQIDLRKVLRIEKRRHSDFEGVRNAYWVLDVRGENAVEWGPFATFSLAQDEWRIRADNILLEWTR